MCLLDKDFFCSLQFKEWQNKVQAFWIESWSKVKAIGIIQPGILAFDAIVCDFYKSMYPVLVIWFLIGKFIGEIVSSILLSLLYFLFIWIGKLFVKVDLSSGWKEKTNAKEYENMG